MAPAEPHPGTSIYDIDEEEQAGEGEDEDKDTASSTIDDDPIEASQSREQAEEVDEDNFAEENIMKYSSREVIEKAVLWQLEVVRLEAVASYERCRALDECPLELQSQQNFLDALEILKMWHEQHKRVSLYVTLYLKEAITEPQSQASSSSRTTSSRRTATQRQLAELPFILQSEAAAGNSMPQVADYWTCLNSQCRNKGKTCWVNKLRPDARDNAADHYPVSGEVFRRWSHEISDKLSTVEQPSQQIIVLLVNWRERERKKSTQAQQTPRPAEDISSTTNQLLQTLIAAQTQQLA
ncbi:MAG: hypothetical protein M1813_006235 [Trichoglossum hirsutum]|nr:MAG: hypothetical protein M1813_006235 [Trichoglossum hirsutum]